MQNMMGDPATFYPANKKTRQTQEDDINLEDCNDDVSPMSQSSQESKSGIAGNLDSESRAPLTSRRRKKDALTQIIISNAEYSNLNAADPQNNLMHLNPVCRRFLNSYFIFININYIYVYVHIINVY